MAGEVYADMQLRQQAVAVHEHREYVVVMIEGASTLRGEFRAVHVYRTAGGRIVHGMVVAAPVDLPTKR